jgi:poly-gamma-glutamate capsule biosynthesis protein CapA/YwtB (metallophosphatase superfamily)
VQTPAERLAARRRAARRRRAVGIAVLTLLVAGAAVGAVLATRGDDAEAARAAQASSTEASPVATTLATLEATVAADEQPASQAPPDATVSFAAVGDIVMGTTTYGLPPDGGRTFFDSVDEELRGDVVLGNLEGTLSTGGGSKCGPGSTDCFAFQMPPSYAKWLERAGFTVLNLANNHAYDYGASGFSQTKRALRRAGLRITGPRGMITVVEAGPVRVALVGFASYAWANDLTDVAAARRLVRKAAARADLVVVTFHGGAEGSSRQHVEPGTEYFLGENRGDVMRFSHAVVGAGADLVVGHGPHVLRGMEWYKGRLIAYSLGNFGGYEVFSLGGPLGVSGVLQVTLRGDGSWVRGALVPTVLVGAGVPAMDPAEQAHGLVRELSREDFGRRAVRLSRTGVLSPPGGG